MSKIPKTIVHERFILKPSVFMLTDKIAVRFELLKELMYAYTRGLDAAEADASQVVVLFGPRYGLDAPYITGNPYIQLQLDFDISKSGLSELVVNLCQMHCGGVTDPELLATTQGLPSSIMFRQVAILRQHLELFIDAHT